MSTLVLLLCLSVALTNRSIISSEATHLFNSHNSWLNNKRNNDENTVRNKLFSLRGGSTDSDKTEKIKGHCIGIDLGTTYR